MLQDTERVITALHNAIKIATSTGDKNEKAIFRAYASIVDILNNCTETDCVACIMDELESIEKDLAFVILGS